MGWTSFTQSCRNQAFRPSVAGVAERQGLASAESQVRCADSSTAGCAVEFGKRILPPTVSIIHSRRALHTRLEIRSHIQPFTGASISTKLQTPQDPSSTVSPTALPHPGCILACIYCTIPPDTHYCTTTDSNTSHTTDRPASLCFVLHRPLPAIATRRASTQQSKDVRFISIYLPPESAGADCSASLRRFEHLLL